MRHTPWLLVGSLLIASVANAAVVVGLDTLGLAMGSVGGFDQLRDEVASATGTDEPIDPTCAWDARLAAAAHAMWCGGPLEADATACLDAVADRLSTDLILCDARRIELPEQVAMAVLSPEQIAAIEPEPLLELLDPLAQAQFEEQQEQQQAQLEQEAKKRVETVPINGQVVETAKPTVEVAPENARFVSEFDTKVEKETVARGARAEDMVAKPKPEELAAKPEARDPTTAQDPTDRPEGRDVRAPDVPGSLRMRSPGSPDPATVAQEAKVAGANDGSTAGPGDGSIRKGDGSISQEQRQISEAARGEGGGGGGQPKVPNLRPNDEVLERVVGGGSVDHVDTDEGDETALNSKRWIHASFFNRAKRLVAQQWEPAQIWRRHDPTGAVYGFKSRVTVLRISLTTSGQVARVIIVHPSGVDVLDDEAVRAFKAAAPFPNPPTALAEQGYITFEFGFHFEIGGGRGDWKIFRQ